MDPTVLSAGDRAVDHALAQLSASMRFLLEITPVDAEDVREAFLDGDVEEPEFTYRTLEVDPDVVAAELERIDVGSVEDTTLAHLLRAKHREMELQVEMLRARDTDDFLGLSIELYGGVSPTLNRQAEALLAAVPAAEPAGDVLDAEEFLQLALEEIDRYREQDPEIEMHAEIRPDVNGVMVSGDTLLVGPESAVQRVRAEALLHHEVGTHLVTQVNGSAQQVKVLGAGLAGYDETQEGMAVLAEIACGGLTAFRLRQLAGRVLTVHRLVSGATFAEAHDALVDAGFPRGQCLHHRDAGLPVRRRHQGRHLPAWPGRPARARARGREPRPALPRASSPWMTCPSSTELDEKGVLEPARISPRYLTTPPRSTGSRRRPTPMSSTSSWRRHHEDRLRRQRHRHRGPALHDQPARDGRHAAWATRRGSWASVTSPTSPTASLSAHARMAQGKNYRSLERHLADVQKPDCEQHIGLEEFDVVMLRNDPADDAESAPWANNAGVAFGQLIASAGVLVVNDPTSLANALSKAYFQHFPEVVRPRTLISRDEAPSPPSSTTWAARPCSSRCRARAAAECS